jgi:phage-related holin
MLKGYKTYIVAGLAVIGAVAGYLTGDVTLSNAIQLVVTAVIGATIRNGITTEAQK